jgi:transcriptional regulator with XRE-family HTH domain
VVAVVPIGFLLFIDLLLHTFARPPAGDIAGYKNLTKPTIPALAGSVKYALTFPPTRPNTMPIEFKDRLRAERDKRGFTQADLGKQAGLPSTTISHFESGSRKPSFDNLRRLTKILGVSTDYLMGLVDTPEATGAASRIARHLTNATEDDIAMLEMLAKSMANKRRGEDG